MKKKPNEKYLIYRCRNWEWEDSDVCMECQEKEKKEVLKASKLRKLKKIYGLGRIKVSKQLQQLVVLKKVYFMSQSIYL